MADEFDIRSVDEERRRKRFTLIYRGGTVGLMTLILGVLSWVGTTFYSLHDEVLKLTTSYDIEIKQLQKANEKHGEQIETIFRLIYSRDGRERGNP